MAINFPDSPTNGQSATLGGNTWTYNSTSGAWARASSAGGSSITTYDSTTDLPLSGVSAGDQAFVTGSNRMYVSNGTGWYSVSLVNTNPSITSVQDSDGGSTPFTLATDGTGSVITITASDPEDVPLTYGYSVTSGSLTNGGGTTATVVQGTDSDVNKFTITPTTTEAYAGNFELTFTASDGVNQGTNANNFTLQFITIVANSRYTTLLATATPKNATVYRYFKFIPQALRSSSDYQICEFELTDGSSYYSPTDAEQLYRSDDSDGDDYVAGQNVAASIDGNTGTKVYNGSWNTKYYLYDMGASFNTVLTGWRYITGDDVDGRDPVSWTLLGSTNNSDWVLLDQRVNETITTSRSTATQDFTFNATNQAFFNAANTNYPIEVNGDAHASTFSPYRSGGYSTYFDGTGDYIDTNSAINLSSGGCIEGWVYITSATNYAFFIASTQGNPGYPRWYVGHSNATDWRCSPGDSTDNNITSYDLITNQWNHFVLSNDGSTSRLFANGVLIFTKSVTPVNENLTFTLSKYGSSAQYLMTGNLFDVRVNTSIPTEYQTSSTTVGASIFTPPTEPLSSSGSALHICHLPYLADGSSNTYTLTPNGNVSTKPFSPYDYTEYSVADHGGSVYFVGGANYSSQYLSLSGPTMPSGDFTLSTWAYLKSNGSDTTLIDFNGNSGGFRIMYSNTGTKYHFRFYVGGGTVYLYDSTSVHPLNQWHYIVVVRSSGTFKLYVNNKLMGTSTANPTFSSSNNVRVGQALGGFGTLEGYLSDIIYNPTTAITDFTPPTAPLSSSGAFLHIKGTDASIIDKSQGSNLKLVGNTTGSTTQVKFANTKSIYFDGGNSVLEIPAPGVLLPPQSSSNVSMDWTIEGWLYRTSADGQNGTVGDGIFAVNSYDEWDEYPANSNINGLSFSTKALSIGQNTSPHGLSTQFTADNQWHHFALVRYYDTSGGSTYVNVYRDGTSVLQLQDAADGYLGFDNVNTPSAFGIFDKYNGSYRYYFQGYMQDLKISRRAVYTGAFTPPTASLEG